MSWTLMSFFHAWQRDTRSQNRKGHNECGAQKMRRGRYAGRVLLSAFAALCLSPSSSSPPLAGRRAESGQAQTAEVPQSLALLLALAESLLLSRYIARSMFSVLHHEE
eukprot:3021376-Rhodomonas_salina.2